MSKRNKRNRRYKSFISLINRKRGVWIIGLLALFAFGGVLFVSISNPEVSLAEDSVSYLQNPNNPGCPYASRLIESPAEDRMETHVSFDLSDEENVQFVGLILPSDQIVMLTSGEIISADALQTNDIVFMSGDRQGVVQTVEHNLYSPQPTQQDEHGNVLRRVIGKSERLTDTILYLYAGGEILETTPEHPFYVDGDWIEAQNLQVGDEMRTRTGTTVTVEQTEIRHEQQMVYSLLVEDSHNFFVGNSGLLAHNCTPTTKDIQRIINRYPPESGKCELCAREIYDLFDEANIDARIGHMETMAPFLTTKDGIQLSRRINNDLAFHEFVQVGDTIYDSLTGPQGMIWDDYMALFYDGVFEDGIINVRFREP